MRTRRRRVGTLAVLSLVGMSACGYGFTSRAAHIPDAARTIAVRPFQNRTDRIGIEVVLRTALEDVIRERGVLQVTSGGDGDLTLTGEIRAFRFTRPVASSRVDRGIIYATTIVVNARLGRRDGSIAWRGDGLVELSDVAVAPGVVIPTSPRFQQGTLDARDVGELSDIQLAEYRLTGEVLRGLVDSMARSIYSEMMEGF
jgi:hypothetical protein